MKRPELVFEMSDYQHYRRKHRHRCQACNRIVQTGQAVLMVKLGKTSLVVHLGEADKVMEPTNGVTYREMFHLWAREQRGHRESADVALAAVREELAPKCHVPSCEQHAGHTGECGRGF